MAATLKDVAAHAGVSVRTVSNVVSKFPHVSEDVRTRVNTAIEVLDYRPNPIARRLRTGLTGVISFIVPEIDVPYFSELAREVIRAADSAGYRVMIDQTGHDHAHEERLLTGTDRTMLFDGMLFAPLVTSKELVAMNRTSKVPLVLLGEHDFDGSFDHVAIDNVQAASDAVTHLITTGRSLIAAIGAQPREHYATPQQRTSGYLRALVAAGFTPESTMQIAANRYSREEGYAAAASLMKADERPDALFCYSDTLAIGAMRAVFDAGLNVPDDVAVIGIDNIEEGRYARPSLSTVSLDTAFVAHEAIARLTARIADRDAPRVQVVARHELVVRGSTVRS